MAICQQDTVFIVRCLVVIHCGWTFSRRIFLKSSSPTILIFFFSWLNLIIKQINHKTMIKARLSTEGLHLIQKKFTWFSNKKKKVIINYKKININIIFGKKKKKDSLKTHRHSTRNTTLSTEKVHRGDSNTIIKSCTMTLKAVARIVKVATQKTKKYIIKWASHTNISFK